MKKIIALLIFLLPVFTLLAQNKIYYYSGGNIIHTRTIETIDSVQFTETGSSVTYINSGENGFEFPVSGIDSMVFYVPSMGDTEPENLEDAGDWIYIIYNNGGAVNVINPWAERGISVSCNSENVVVSAASGTFDRTIHVSGTTTNGSLTITTDNRFNLILGGTSITNPNGAAINVVSDKKVTLKLQDETTNTLTDGSASTAKAALFCEGAIEVYNNGTLNVSGNRKHGINSDAHINVYAGTINITSAVSDGLHANNFRMYGGNINVSGFGSDGIEAEYGSELHANEGVIDIMGGQINITAATDDTKGLKCDTLKIQGGNVEITASGNQSKGMKTGIAYIAGGTTNITASGTTVVTAGDPSYCTGIKATDIYITNGNLTISCPETNIGGKGISVDNLLSISNGTINLSVSGAGATYTNVSNVEDNYESSCIKSDATVEINGGTITLIAAGESSKGVSCDNVINILGGDISVTLSGKASKAFKSDVALNMQGGNIIAEVSGATLVNGTDASNSVVLKSDGTITIDGGVLEANCTSQSGGAKGISSVGNLVINGGNITISTAGAGATLNGTGTSCTDGYAACCIKSDADMTILGGTINCTSTGKGGKGISCGGILTIGEQNGDDKKIDIDVMTSGAGVNASSSSGGFPGGTPGGSSSDYWKGLPKGIKAVGNIVINSGHVSSYCAQTSGDPTGEAIESKAGIYINGGYIEANAYDDAINCATHFEINGGYVWAYARGNDGIDCNGAYTNFNGGFVVVAGTEEAIDANSDGMGGTQGHLVINGSTIIAYRASSSGMGGGMALLDSPTYQNGQKYLVPTFTAGSSYCIKNNSDNTVLIYSHPSGITGSGFADVAGTRPPGGGPGGSSSVNYVFTSPNVTSGTYTMFTNPTISGETNWHGIYIDASATTSGSGTSLSAQ